MSSQRMSSSVGRYENSVLAVSSRTGGADVALSCRLELEPDHNPASSRYALSTALSSVSCNCTGPLTLSVIYCYSQEVWRQSFEVQPPQLASTISASCDVLPSQVRKTSILKLHHTTRKNGTEALWLQASVRKVTPPIIVARNSSRRKV
mmetsp:Transcript_37355/g.78217  ORF Transcript_37355/g.78217 Transcript_37355/m.78217 type:complete len:149 (-) Transcript_37355:26-472(-)